MHADNVIIQVWEQVNKADMQRLEATLGLCIARQLHGKSDICCRWSRPRFFSLRSLYTSHCCMHICHANAATVTHSAAVGFDIIPSLSATVAASLPSCKGRAATELMACSLACWECEPTALAAAAHAPPQWQQEASVYSAGVAAPASAGDGSGLPASSLLLPAAPLGPCSASSFAGASSAAGSFASLGPLDLPDCLPSFASLGCVDGPAAAAVSTAVPAAATLSAGNVHRFQLPVNAKRNQCPIHV